MNDLRRSAPAALRNREPILAVLSRVLPSSGRALTIAEGTGEHAVYFARNLPGLEWLPSDRDPDALPSIAAWIEHESDLKNLRPPALLDVTDVLWPVAQVEAILCINMIHIAPWACTQALMRGAAAILAPEGPLVLYGAYKVGGHHTAPSNVAFDAWLKERDPRYGVRDIEAVIEVAAACGLAHAETIPMPANNFIVVFRSLLPRRSARGSAPGTSA